jgi:hypothetical protein
VREYNKDNVDEMVLALMYLSTFKDLFGLRVWKGLDWGVLDILHEKRYSIILKSRTKSETITEQAVKIFRKVIQEISGRR